MSEEIVYHDVVRWAEENVKIVTLDNGLCNISLYPRQKEILTDWNTNRRNILVSSRQVGLTTMVLVDALHKAIYKPDCMIVVLCTKSSMAEECISRISKMVDILWSHKTKERIRFLNGSEIICTTYSESGLRGRTINHAYLMDYDYISPHIQSGVFKSIMPSMSYRNDYSMIIASCPSIKNIDSHYNIVSLFNMANSGDSGFKGNKFFWNQIPDRDEKWKDQMMQCLGADKEEIFKYEFNCGE
jgi:hypothetical protein